MNEAEFLEAAKKAGSYDANKPKTKLAAAELSRAVECIRYHDPAPSDIAAIGVRLGVADGDFTDFVKAVITLINALP